MFLPANITLKFGDSGDFVSELQRRLTAVHCFSTEPNGFFDGVTASAVSAFQSMSGIHADGIAGPETLRHLNGVISGDNSSTAKHDEEQNRLRQEEAARQIQQQAYEQQQRAEAERLEAERIARETPQWNHTQAPQQPEIRYAQEAAYAPQQAPAQSTQQPTAEQLQMQMQQQLQQHLAQQQQQAQHAAQHVQPPVQQAQPAPAHQPQPVQAITVQHAPQVQHAPAQVHVITPQQPAAVAAAAAAAAHAASGQHQQVATHAAEPAAAPKGIVGRAMQYANDMVQKLANYFESKLPNNVIEEVKNIGQTMARSGVKEVAIPTGPEPQRGAETPARGPQQQAQISHRG